MSNMDVVKVSSDCGTNLYISIPHGTVRVTILNKCPEVGWISTLMVDENWRGKGIGNELLRSAEKVSRENKCSVSSLQVVSDSWMREWYEKNGYFVTADGYEEDMIIVTKKLDYIEEYPVGVWIPVDRGIPPKWNSDDCYSRKVAVKTHNNQKYWYTAEYNYRYKEWICDENNTYRMDDGDVTHWMLLPYLT